jgi:hypothetical protein
MLAFKFWLKYALLAGRPWKSIAQVIWDKVESVGTKGYTISELRKLFDCFPIFEATPIITKYDTDDWPVFISKYFPNCLGWFIGVRANK